MELLRIVVFFEKNMEYVGYERAVGTLRSTEPLLKAYQAPQNYLSATPSSGLDSEYFGIGFSKLCKDVTDDPGKYGLPSEYMETPPSEQLVFEDRYSTHGTYLEETRKLERLSFYALYALEQAIQFKKEARRLGALATLAPSNEESLSAPRTGPDSCAQGLKVRLDRLAQEEAEAQHARTARFGNIYDKLASTVFEMYRRLTDPDLVMRQDRRKSQEVQSALAFSWPAQQGYLDSIKSIRRFTS